jgi:hypothetical protein
MPQPLPKGTKHIHFTSDADVIDKRPDLAKSAAKVVSAWPRLELAMGVLFVTLIRGDPKPTAAVFSSIRNTQAQTDAFAALAEVSLSDQEEKDILSFILKRYTKAAKSRDVLAHHVWATMDEYPDAIIMLNPKGLAAAVSRMYASVAVPSPNDMAAFDVLEIYREAAQVWTKEGFVDAERRIEKVNFWAMTFMAMRPNPQRPSRDETARQTLLSEPDLAAHVLRCAQNRKKSP